MARNRRPIELVNELNIQSLVIKKTLILNVVNDVAMCSFIDLLVFKKNCLIEFKAKTLPKAKGSKS